MHNPSGDKEKHQRAVCVFCGSSPGRDPRYAEAARELGTLLAANGFSLVFGGGNIGLMGEVARAVRAGGAQVTSVIPDFLHQKLGRSSVDADPCITQTMHERKARMFDLADIFVTLPGGIGTLEETLEILTWAQLGLHSKNLVLVNLEGYWDPLVECLSLAISHKFMDATVLNCFHIVSTPQGAMDVISNIARNL